MKKISALFPTIAVITFLVALGVAHAASVDYRLTQSITSEPTKLQATHVTPHSVTLQWTGVSDASSYLVEISTHTGQQIIIAQEIKTTKATFRYRIKPNRAYLAKVKAVNSDDVGGNFSSVGEFRTPPAKITNVSFLQWEEPPSGEEGANAVLRWPSARGMVKSYTVKVVHNGKTLRTFSVLPSGKKNTLTTIHGLTSTETYSVSVRTKHDADFIGKYSTPLVLVVP